MTVDGGVDKSFCTAKSEVEQLTMVSNGEGPFASTHVLTEQLQLPAFTEASTP